MKITKLCAVLASLCVMSWSAQALELKFGHVGKPGSLFAESVENFAKIANAKLGSKAKVVVYGSSLITQINRILCQQNWNCKTGK